MYLLKSEIETNQLKVDSANFYQICNEEKSMAQTVTMKSEKNQSLLL